MERPTTVGAIALTEHSDQQCFVFKMAVKQQTTLRSVAILAAAATSQSSTVRRRALRAGHAGTSAPPHPPGGGSPRACLRRAGPPARRTVWRPVAPAPAGQVPRWHRCDRVPPQGSLCVRRARLAQDGPHHCYRFVAQHAATRRSLRPVDRIGEHPGTVPLYSGVAIRTAFDTASTSSLKKGNWPISKNRTSTHSGASSSAARSSPRL
jgi:hypothetical protein